MFLFDRLFREKAVERIGRPDPLDRMLRVTAPHEWMLLAGSGLALLGFAAWGVFGAMELAVSSHDCVLARPGARYAVVSARAGVVVEVLAQAGDRVADGQALARIATPAAAEAEAEAGDFIVSPRAGELMALELTPGRLVAAMEPLGMVRDGADDRLEALAFLPPERAQRVEAGMAAQLRVAAPESRQIRVLAAEISEISARPVPRPHWIEYAGPLASGQVYRVRGALAESGGAGAGDGIPDGTGCEARVILGRQAPVRLLLPQADG